MSISLDQFDSGRADDTARRDQWGRYLILPPGGPKPIGYTRVTTVAKALDDYGALAPWKATMAAYGIIMRPGLRSRWEALLAQHGDPWYAQGPAKAECKRLVEDCAAVGGANDRREMGSSLHTLTALVDVGKKPTYLTPETQRDVDAYMAGRRAAGIEVVPGMIEVCVVLDDYQVAGTFDRLVTVPGYDLPLVSDLKTGSNLEYSYQSIAIQMAAYSRGVNIYVQGDAADGSKDQRLTMPAVDQDRGLIFWLPGGEGELRLILVDLNAGWEAFSHAMWARGWRKAHPEMDFATAPPVPTPDTGLEAALQASITQAQARHPATPKPEADRQLPTADPRNQLPSGEAPAPPLTADTIKTPGFSEAAQDLETVHDVRNWLQGRINDIGAHPQARTALGRAWPEDIPTLAHSRTHSVEQLGAIELLLNDIEKRYELAFPPPKPEPDIGHIVALFPGSNLVSDSDSDNPKGPAA